ICSRLTADFPSVASPEPRSSFIDDGSATRNPTLDLLPGDDAQRTRGEVGMAGKQAGGEGGAQIRSRDLDAVRLFRSFDGKFSAVAEGGRAFIGQDPVGVEQLRHRKRLPTSALFAELLPPRTISAETQLSPPNMKIL